MFHRKHTAVLIEELCSDTHTHTRAQTRISNLCLHPIYLFNGNNLQFNPSLLCGPWSECNIHKVIN